MATTLKLPPELKARVAAVAEGSGKSPHAFMIDAIEAETARAEQRRSFVRDAQQAEAEVERTGKVYGMDDVHEFVREKLAGKQAKRPRPKKWPR